MPLFEYACRKCGHRFEVLVRSASQAPGACPACRAKRIEKQLSTFAPAVASSSPPCASGACVPGGGCAGSGCSPAGGCPFG